MTDYLPEGRLIQCAENRLWVESIDSLAEAMHQKTVIGRWLSDATARKICTSGWAIGRA